MCPSLIEIGSKTAEKNSAQTNRQTDIHYENNGHLAVNQKRVNTTYKPQSSRSLAVYTDCHHLDLCHTWDKVARL